MNNGPLPIDFPQHLIAHELGYGERILWSGRPRQGAFLRMHDAVYIPITLLMGGFVLIAVAQTIDRGKADVGTSLLALAWFYLLVGRFLVDAWQRSKTWYVVTDQQVLIVSGVFRTKVKGLRLRDLYGVRLSLGRRGRGTITLGVPGAFGAPIPGLKSPELAVPTLDSIEHAYDVYEQIRPRVEP